MNTINLPEIYIINALGVLLIIGNVISGYFNAKRNIEDKYLFWITVCICASCVVESVVYTLYGRPALLYRLILYLGYLWLFFSIFVIGPLWVLLLEKHNRISNSKLLQSLINYISLLGVAVLAINFYRPLVFYIDESGIYHRGQFFWFYILASLFFFCSGIGVYILKRKITMIPFFPAFQIFIPILVGLISELLFYGTSMIWAACAVSVTLMIMSLQNENICKDKLTGLFNRYYLDRIDLSSVDKGILCFMMIDINGFKLINDKFGHSEGDRGLKFVSECVTKSVGNQGNVIRYAGDEFVVMLNTKDYKEAESCIKRINENLDEVNKLLKKDYSLSLSIGYEIFDMRVIKMDEVLEVIDKKMYMDKKKYYSTHDRRLNTEIPMPVVNDTAADRDIDIDKDINKDINKELDINIDRDTDTE